MTHVRLGPRERQVADGITLGLNRAQIAAYLGLDGGYVSILASRARRKGHRLAAFHEGHDEAATQTAARPLVLAGIGCAEIGRRLGVTRQRGFQLRKAILEGKRDWRHA